MYKVNILPLELHRNINVDVKKLIKIMTVFIITAILLAAYGTFIISFYSTGKEIAEAEKELVRLQDIVKKVEEIRKQRQNNELSVQNFKDLIDNRKTWSYMLEELNSSLPADIWLESIDLSFVSPQTPNFLTVEGYSRTVPSVGILVNSLGRMPYFNKIVLSEIRKDERHAALKFKITATIR